MKIKREILGHTIDIELTPEEIRDAYLVEQHSNDMEDLGEYLTQNGFHDIPILFVHALTREYRQHLDKGYAQFDAFEKIVKDHPNVLEIYKEE